MSCRKNIQTLCNHIDICTYSNIPFLFLYIGGSDQRSSVVPVLFRFLDRTDSRRCRSLIRSCGERCGLNHIVLADFVRGERSECISPLTTRRIKHAWQVWRVHAVRPSTCQTPLPWARKQSDRCKGGVKGRLHLPLQGPMCEIERSEM
jgi:hypothetical protein